MPDEEKDYGLVLIGRLTGDPTTDAAMLRRELCTAYEHGAEEAARYADHVGQRIVGMGIRRRIIKERLIIK